MTSQIFVVMSGYEFSGDTPRAAFTDEKAAEEYSTEMSKKENPLPFWVAQCALDPRLKTTTPEQDDDTNSGDYDYMNRD